ncbi:MAG: hypothetical protein AB1758_05855 [Candidatus Eremiobacterota bacterium]
MSELVDQIVRVLARGLEIQADRDSILEIVDSHGLLEAPSWMVSFFRDIAEARPTETLLELPHGYPAGAEGLSNLLADLSDLGALGIDDCGEEALWKLPRLDIQVFISREYGRRGYDCACIRPIGSDLAAWLVDQYRARRP